MLSVHGNMLVRVSGQGRQAGRSNVLGHCDDKVVLLSVDYTYSICRFATRAQILHEYI